MRPKLYEIDGIAKVIANNHAKDHLTFEKEAWLKLGINPTNFEQHIVSVLKDKNTKVFQYKNGKRLTDNYYHKKTNTFISVDLSNKHGGTCFIPDKKDYFKKQFDDNRQFRHRKKIKQNEIKKGGFDALYKGKKLDKVLKYKIDKKANRFGAKKEHDKRLKDEKKAKAISLQNFKLYQAKEKAILDKQNLINKNKVELDKKATISLSDKLKAMAENKRDVAKKLAERATEIENRKAQANKEKQKIANKSDKTLEEDLRKQAEIERQKVLEEQRRLQRLKNLSKEH